MKRQEYRKEIDRPRYNLDKKDKRRASKRTRKVLEKDLKDMGAENGFDG